MDSKTYWLIKEVGRNGGVGTVDLDTAITSDFALEKFLEQWDIALGYPPAELEAVLMTTWYSKDGMPHYIEGSIIT